MRTKTKKTASDNAQQTSLDDALSIKNALSIKIDPELGRVAMGLGVACEFRVWSVARHFYGIPGWVERETLFHTLKSARVVTTKRNFNRLLRTGDGLFWELPRNRVYLRGYIRVTRQLVKHSLTSNPVLVATNVPGVPSIFVKAGGDLGDFKANVYGAWLAYRESPIISRAALCKLFACSDTTLRNWEQRLGQSLEIIHNRAQTALNPKENRAITAYLPTHAYEYATKHGDVHLRWQQPNTYRPNYFRQHPGKGQSRKARTAASITAWFQPVEINGHHFQYSKACFDRTHREPKRYFKDDKHLKSFLRRLAEQDIQGITPETPRYIFLGIDHNEDGIWELSLDGGTQTSATERMNLRHEKQWWAAYRKQQALPRQPLGVEKTAEPPDSKHKPARPQEPARQPFEAEAAPEPPDSEDKRIIEIKTRVRTKEEDEQYFMWL